MNIKKHLNAPNILLFVALLLVLLNGIMFAKHVQLVADDKQTSDVRYEVLKDEIISLKSSNLTFETVDKMMDERAQFQKVDEYEFEDKTGGIDLSQPANQPNTYKMKSTGKTTIAGDETCGTDENRLHWELFRTPAPGCENTPYKGM